MALLADPIRFGEPISDFVIDLVYALETKGVQMISRRESFDPAEARTLQTSRQDDVAVDPIPANDERCETHADLESDPRLFREDDDRSTPLCDRQQFVEDRADALRLSCEMRCERGAAPARVGLIPIRKLPTTLWAAPQFRARLVSRRGSFRSSDRSSDNGRGRSGNSRRWPARGAGNFAGTCRTSNRKRPENRCR
jgi:hypothetical protein